MQKTSIAWTDYSWTPINGCRRISPGCGAADGGGCYAERLAATRLRQHEKYIGLARMTNGHPQWTGDTRLWEPELRAPLTVKKRSRIFVVDMGDLFYHRVPDTWIDQVFAVMWNASWHQFQVLTKRPERMHRYLTDPARVEKIAQAAWRQFEQWEPRKASAGLLSVRDFEDDIRLPLPNVWVGTSTENQQTANERLWWLIQTPAAVRFLSVEPLLGMIDLRLDAWFHPQADRSRPAHMMPGAQQVGHLIHWVIVGGDSGPQYRTMELRWLQFMVNQCREANIPAFVKQDSGLRPGQQGHIPDELFMQEFPLMNTMEVRP